MDEPKDYFSTQAEVYSRSRPRYPEELIQFIASLCSDRKLAWDCATGNGQAARTLAHYFKNVIATDTSSSQISHAMPVKNVEYRNERAEQSSFESNTVDLVTVATAAHWFNLPLFYDEVNRVLKPGGMLAIWSYAGCRINASVDAIVIRYEAEILRNYWPNEAALNWEKHYETLSFPYPLIKVPQFTAQAKYTFHDLRNYLHSWSAAQEYIKQHNEDPFLIVEEGLKKAWGNNPEETKQAVWKLFMKIGRKPELES